MSPEVLSFFGSWSIKAVVLTLLCGVLFLTLRRHAPSARARYLTVVTLSFLSLPLLVGLLPTWSPKPLLDLSHAWAVREALPGASAAAPVGGSDTALWSEPVLETVISVPEPPSAAESASTTSLRGLGSLPWGLLGFTVWLVGAGALMTQFAWALVRLELLRRRARPTDLRPELCHPGVPVVEAPVRSAVTFGALRPVIVLPSLWRRWSPERLAVVLAHEMQHVRRRDWCIRLLGEVVACLYWPLPLTWMALRRLRLEQELSCDQAVIASGLVHATRYGEHLIDLATARGPSPALAATIVHKTTLEERLMKLHESADRRRRATVLPLLTLLMAAPLLAAIGAEEPVSPDLRAALVQLDALHEELAPLEAQMQEREMALHPYMNRLEEMSRQMERQLAAVEAEGVREMERAIEERARRLEELHRSTEKARRAEHEELVEAERQLHALQQEVSGLQRQVRDAERATGQAGKDALAQGLAELEQRRAQLIEAREAMAQRFEVRIDAETEEAMARLQAEVEEIAQQHAAKMEGHQSGLEPLQREMAEIQAEMAEAQEGLQEVHEELSRVHEKIEPVLKRLQEAQRDEMSERLGSAFGSAPSARTLDRFEHDIDWQIRDGALRLRGSAATLRELLREEYPNASASKVDAVVLDLLSLDIQL